MMVMMLVVLVILVMMVMVLVIMVMVNAIKDQISGCLSTGLSKCFLIVVGSQNRMNVNFACRSISHMPCMLICFMVQYVKYLIICQVHYTSSTLYVKYVSLMIAEYSSDWSVTSSLARTGQKVGKFVEGWTRDTQHSEGRTLGGHWTLCPAGTPNGERCQPETLDTVFQGSQKAAKEALVFSPSYMRVSHVVIDKSINEVREIFAGNRMLELFLLGAIVRGRKIGEMGWVVK